MAIQSFTDLNLYYEDPSQWGNYQYVTIKDLVNNFMFSQDDDSWIANIDRQKVVYWAKRAVQELYYDVVNEVISLEYDLNPTLIVSLPHDYVQYVAISWVDSNGKKHPLSIDKSSNLAQAYLQDNDYEFLFDSDGDALQGSHLQDLNPTPLSNNLEDLDTVRISTPNFNTDLSKIFKNGSYVIDKERGIIQFSSAVIDKTIAIDYISDGLFQRGDSDIRIHKFAENATIQYIYWNLTMFRKTVHANEKARARAEWFNSRRVAKRRMNPIRYEEIRQVMKGTSKMIKD